MRYLTCFLLLSISAFADDQCICVRADHSFRGPFTHQEPVADGETKVVLTADQYASVDALHKAHPLAKLTFDGNAFAVTPIDTTREQLLALFASLSPEERAFYLPAYDAVKGMFDAGNGAGAKSIIAWLRTPTDHLATIQQQMLALFPAE